MNQLPMLVIPTKGDKHGLYSVDHNIKGIQFDFSYDKRCCGSSHGYLAMVEDTLAIKLFNPLSRKTVLLPPLEKIHSVSDPQFYVFKVILSADPFLSPNNDYTVVAIFTMFRRLAVIKSTHKSWTYIEKEKELQGYTDALFSKDGQLYVVNKFSSLISITIRDNGSYELKTIVSHTFPQLFRSSYIVESCEGELLLIKRFPKDDDDDLGTITSRFEVFKLVDSNCQCKWVLTNSLGDNALFVGDNHSMLVSTLEFPCCQSNSIFYTDDYMEFGMYKSYGPVDLGVFNLSDGSIGKHYIIDSSQTRMPPTIWILPTL